MPRLAGILLNYFFFLPFFLAFFFAMMAPLGLRDDHARARRSDGTSDSGTGACSDAVNAVTAMEMEVLPALRLDAAERMQKGMRLPKAWIRLELDNVKIFGSHHGPH